MIPKAKAIRPETNKWDHIKLKSSYIAKEAINKLKGQPTGYEKIFASHISNKRLISIIYKKPI